MGKSEVPANQQENPWTSEATNLQRTVAIRNWLAKFGIPDFPHATIILAILDNHGLFHEVITPRKGDTGKEISRRAKRMTKSLWRRIANIRKGRKPPADSNEADLAERWPQVGEHQMYLEQLHVLSETFQINRGGRIITRYATKESLTVPLRGPRLEPEITHVVQILDRYLKEECSLCFTNRRECLGGIIREAMDLQHSSEDEVIEQVRWRLRNVKNKNPLHNVDYFESIGVSFKLNDGRQERFLDCMLILNSPQASAEEKILAENTLEQQFSFK